MPEDLLASRLNTDTYDLCVKAFRTTRKLLKINIKLHIESEQDNHLEQGDIFLFNHFSRFETFIPQYLIHEETGLYCHSIAASSFFKDPKFSQFLYSVGVLPNNEEGLFPFLAREILHGRKLIIFPEGGMVKDKRVIDHAGQYNIFSRTARERRKHHRGAAVIALALDAFKTALLHDYSTGNYSRVDRWAEELGFETTEALLHRALKPTLVVPGHITFYPIRISENILYQAVNLLSKGVNKRFAEELIIEGNLLFKHTDMDIRFAKPLVMRDYWRWWEKRLLPHVVRQFDGLHELFTLHVDSGHWRGRMHARAMHGRSNSVRDDYMRSMYQAVTVNLSHIASTVILKLYERGIQRIARDEFHRMLYLSIKRAQKLDLPLHRSLLNPEEYHSLVYGGSNRLDQFLQTSRQLELVHTDDDSYIFDKKLMADFDFDEIRTENLICVYANEVTPLSKLTAVIEGAMKDSPKMSGQDIAMLELEDQRLTYQWDYQHFHQPQHEEINQQQTATADANWFFLKSTQANASGVLLIHGFLAGPEEVRSLGERLHAQGFHVLGVRLKGHGTSPWDLRSQRWQDWAKSVNHGYQILRAFSERIHMLGFSTGGLLAVHQATQVTDESLLSLTSVSAPIKFRNKNLIFVPLLHHANKLVSWFNSEGLVPFRSNEPENPHINYQHIPIRAVYQLQQLVAHIQETKPAVAAPVYLFQADEDPVVDPASVNRLSDCISAPETQITMINSKRHGILYHNDGDLQQTIVAYLKKFEASELTSD